MASTKKVKSPSATKPSAPKPDNQFTLDALVDRLIKLADVVELHVDNVNKRIDVLLTEGIDKPAEPKRPTLKWFEQEPQPIDWCVCCDPARLILTPGTTLRYNIDDETITTYDGVTIGELNSLGHNIICDGIKQGAKVHVYLTTARRLGIKLGRPA